MPKNRYAPIFNSVLYADNCTELYCEDNLYGTGKGNCTLTGITTADWANIANNKGISVYFYDAAGSQSSTRAFLGIVASSKYITQKSVEVQFEDYSLKLKRWPVSKDVVKDRFQYTRENATVGELVNIFATEEMAASGGTYIVSIGTVDGSSDTVAKFDGFFASRWDMFLKLAQQLNCFVYIDNSGNLQFRKVRGYSVADSGSGTASGSTFTDGSKSWGTNAYRGYVLIDTKNAFIIASNTSTVLTVNGSPTSGNYQIADMVQARGTGTATGSTFYVAGAGWTANQWTGYTLLDVASAYLILSNTTDTLTVSGTPTTGAFQILMGFYSSGGSKNAAFSDRQYNGYNIWNDVTVVGYNGVTSNYRDISTKVAYTTQTDTRLARDFNSDTDTVIYLESVAGIPNEAGIVLIQGGTRNNFTGAPAFAKQSGYYYYAGTSGNTLTGVSCWGTYTNPIKESGGITGGATYSSKTKVQFMHKLRVTSTTGFSSSGNLLIGTEVVPYSSKGNDYFLLGEVGTGVASGSTFTDSSKSWATNQWAGYALVDTSSTGAPPGYSYPITSNTATALTVTGSPVSGTYMIVHGLSGLPLYFRPPVISTSLTAAAQATDTSLTVSSTSAFDSAGILKIYSGGGGVEIIEYASKDSTHFLSCQRGAQNTAPIYIPNGSGVISYYSTGIHPTQVRVQQYPSGGTPETGSSIQVNGRMPKTFPYPYALTIENAEQIASRLLMNHRWGDQFVQFCGYSPRHYQNVNVGHAVQFTDSTLDLNRYTDKIVHKELHQHFADGEFFSKFAMGVQPKSEMDKLLDKIYELVGMKNPNNQQYITGDTPFDILTLQCGSPAVRLNAPGLDVSNPAGKGFFNANYLWLQPFSSSGPQFHVTPFYSYGSKIDSAGLVFPGQTITPPTTTEVETGLEGAIYYNPDTLEHKLYFHNGTTWVDMTGGGGGYWQRIDYGGGNFQLEPVTAGDHIYTTGTIGSGSFITSSGLIGGSSLQISYGGTLYIAFGRYDADNIRVYDNLLPTSSSINIGSAATYWNQIFASELAALTKFSCGGNAAYHYLWAYDANNLFYDALGSSANINISVNPKGTGVFAVHSDCYPYLDNTYDLGSASMRWAEAHATTAYIGTSTEKAHIFSTHSATNSIEIAAEGTSAVIQLRLTPKGGESILMNGSTVLSGTLSAGHIEPFPSATYDLGSSTYKWRGVYASGAVNAQKVLCDSGSSGRLRIPVGTNMYG
jgi:hypothetical protein